MSDHPEACGENSCYCISTSSEHADHACGCDCPRCDECGQSDDYCTC
ncbi:hypothetical protein [Streptomyces jumonjinensis]